jgi:hypothetical protein
MAPTSAQDVVAVKRLIRYLSGTRYYGLVLGGTGESTLIAYSDAGWGGDVDRKSTSRALHYFGEDLVHWTSKKQGCVALSCAEEVKRGCFELCPGRDMASWCTV